MKLILYVISGNREAIQCYLYSTKNNRRSENSKKLDRVEKKSLALT